MHSQCIFCPFSGDLEGWLLFLPRQKECYTLKVNVLIALMNSKKKMSGTSDISVLVLGPFSSHLALRPQNFEALAGFSLDIFLEPLV